jgi:hypothetical protein
MVLKPQHHLKYKSLGPVFRNWKIPKNYYKVSVADSSSEDSGENDWTMNGMAEPPSDKSMENCDRIKNETFHSTPIKAGAIGKGWLKNIGMFCILFGPLSI